MGAIIGFVVVSVAKKAYFTKHILYGKDSVRDEGY